MFLGISNFNNNLRVIKLFLMRMRATSQFTSTLYFRRATSNESILLIIKLNILVGIYYIAFTDAKMVNGIVSNPIQGNQI